MQRWVYEDMIDRYSQRFKLNPDFVFGNTTFDTVTLFLLKWRDEDEYMDTYQQIEKDMNAIPTQPQ